MKNSIVWSALVLIVFVGVSSYLISVGPEGSFHATGKSNLANTATSIEVQYGTNVVEGNCTQTKDFWISHPEAWPVNELSADWVTWMDVLNAPTDLDARVVLAQEFLSAKLSIAKGAEDTEISTTLAEAEVLLDINSATAVEPTALLGQEMIALASKISLFNRGLIGPGNCSA